MLNFHSMPSEYSAHAKEDSLHVLSHILCNIRISWNSRILYEIVRLFPIRQFKSDDLQLKLNDRRDNIFLDFGAKKIIWLTKYWILLKTRAYILFRSYDKCNEKRNSDTLKLVGFKLSNEISVESSTTLFHWCKFSNVYKMAEIQIWSRCDTWNTYSM